MAENHVCIKEGELGSIKTKLDNHDNEISDLKKVYDIMRSLSENTAVMTSELKNLKEDVLAIKGDVEDIKKIPADDHRHYKRAIITGIITLIIGFVFGVVMKGVV